MRETIDSTASDIPSDSWINRLAPKSLKPYLRLARIDRPVGIWLLLFPCWWSISLATSGAWPDWRLIALFAAGALVMRGAGCTLNDIADREFDGRVTRTASRPLPSGVVSVRQALLFLILQLAAGLLILLCFNSFTMIVGAASLLLVALYPFMKRITHWPQAVLGLTFNWGALLGWAAVRGDLGTPAMALYGAGVLWTLGYDTIYAHQDKSDDIRIGVKSVALKLADSTRPWLFIFYGGAVALLALAGILAGLAWPFYAFLTLAAGHLAWQVTMVDLNEPKDCLAKFKSNQHFGWIVLIGVLAGQLLA
ncbi:MAG TPA: 4-hydroxybenzoate octaprenyltransferase [Rhodospirillales bacterium]|jgi:4-hydroxybenzoate polyprenyltransferase|nr:4-hydroxybenzoate octaprenyltransferase [Rhodospirillaceae bacterium]HIJ92951.1 4-hydroxybenzoate octaprenyltransferase [Rhodospirillaceae bacterium]HJN22699.1 4-hydroxybenzoate octaprenyltransferase [Rhodospirillales bacterium]|tara:strand:- start:241 stop:1164 length:924 start_codon:yes stop_codon:yes gene_type:complete